MLTVSTTNSKLKTNGTQEVPLRLKANFASDELFLIMTVLNRLVPFAFASILQSLAFIHPNNEDGDELTLDDVQGVSDDESEGEKSERGVDGKKLTSGKPKFTFIPYALRYRCLGQKATE
ncbi:unnamed protein product [Rodentolepis nana]|uniref:Uncharacterized protein n=1 Tax=Rodentolepis nana TaxID=102285 RepID=A0A0R3TCL4_RODNA|nr:unnamed protein product [Rodentolepis nana]